MMGMCEALTELGLGRRGEGGSFQIFTLKHVYNPSDSGGLE